jgi:colicin import membrane protein
MLKIIRDNPRAFLLAVAAHLLLAVFLSLNLDWSSSHKLATPQVDVIQAVMIDESKIRAEKEHQRKLEEEKRRKQLEAEKRRKQAELKKKQEAERKRKAEAERKRKLEQQRKAEAQRKKQEAEKKHQAELEKQRKAEAERQRKLEQERKRKAEAERQRREAEERRRAEEERIRQQQIAAEQAAMEAARQKALASERDKYMALIQRRVEEKWVRPASWSAGTSCTVTVRLVPSSGGVARVIDARMVKSCGNPLFDHSVENAVFSASPLPFPTSPALMNEFRQLTFNFRPED